MSEAAHYGKHPEWSDEKIAALRVLYDEGVTRAAMVQKLGGAFSRNAICGKLHRLGLTKSPLKASAPPAPAKPRPKKTVSDISLAALNPKERGRPFNPKSMAPLVKIAEPVPFTNGARITIMELTRDTCRWPIGDPGTEDFCFCGHAPRFNSSYCEYHARAAYQPVQDAKRRIHDVGFALPNFTGLSK